MSRDLSSGHEFGGKVLKRQQVLSLPVRDKENDCKIISRPVFRKSILRF